jgi:hypothetical protein
LFHHEAPVAPFQSCVTVMSQLEPWGGTLQSNFPGAVKTVGPTLFDVNCFACFLMGVLSK